MLLYDSPRLRRARRCARRCASRAGAHRVVLRDETWARGIPSTDIVRRVIDRVPGPPSVRRRGCYQTARGRSAAHGVPLGCLRDSDRVDLHRTGRGCGYGSAICRSGRPGPGRSSCTCGDRSHRAAPRARPRRRRGARPGPARLGRRRRARRAGHPAARSRSGRPGTGSGLDAVCAARSGGTRLHSRGKGVGSAHTGTGPRARPAERWARRWEEEAPDGCSAEGLAEPAAPRPPAAPSRALAVFSGAHLPRHRGGGTDFADLRPYVAGDRLRDLSWAATARAASPG